jgi:hypothetical protein
MVRRANVASPAWLDDPGPSPLLPLLLPVLLPPVLLLPVLLLPVLLGLPVLRLAPAQSRDRDDQDDEHGRDPRPAQYPHLGTPPLTNQPPPVNAETYHI